MWCIEREILIMIMIVIWFYNLRKANEARPRRRKLEKLVKIGKIPELNFLSYLSDARMLAKWLLGVDYHFNPFFSNSSEMLDLLNRVIQFLKPAMTQIEIWHYCMKSFNLILYPYLNEQCGVTAFCV